MGEIRILPDEVKNLLRAGEVVERPAGAVKELVENSLDAGARRIRVEIKQGGKRLILVADDGIGMGPDDALLSIERHSTSKISLAEDLQRIRTLGFRGEALPSIASVSRFTLITAPRGAGQGVSIEMDGGRPVCKPAAHEGTAVCVKDLFYNTPARRKFLKSDQTECAHVVNVVTKEALAHPEAGFSLVVDGAESVSLAPAADLRERIVQLYGAEFMEGLARVDYQRNGAALKGFVSKSGNFRAGRSHQYLFVNGRPVRDPSLAYAVKSALAAPDKSHPIFFLFLDIDPARADVNVHPQKEEVRFREKDAVYRLVLQAVGAATRAPEEARLAGGADASPAGPVFLSETAPYPPSGGFEAGTLAINEALPLEYEGAKAISFLKIADMFYAYPTDRGLMLVDQHAAHERIMYEKFMDRVSLKPSPLLFPRQLRFAPHIHAALIAQRELLEDLAIRIEDFGQGAILLRAVPEPASNGDLEGLLSEAAAAIIEERGTREEIKKNMAAKLACHSSVRGSEELGQEELRRLIKDLEACRDPEHCPHGRPTRVFISPDGLRRMFRRK